jgi:hypothetical protein
MAKKKRSKSPRDPVVYELRSVNLSNLPEKEQGAVLDRFASFLDSLTEPTTFHIVQDEREVGPSARFTRSRTSGSSWRRSRRRTPSS